MGSITPWYHFVIWRDLPNRNFLRKSVSQCILPKKQESSDKETKESLTSIEKSINRIKNSCVQAAERYFEDGDPLKDKIIEYYAHRPETDDELKTILGKLNDEDRDSYVKLYEDYINNQTRFTEQMERFFDHVSMFKRKKELIANPEVATDQEYELGTYFDFLEPQVRDAVREMQKKGYMTFRSGFEEDRNKRGQFFDFYDKNIDIPEAFIERLKEKSIEVKVDQFYDRTTVTFHPATADAIRLSEWKDILTDFAESLPSADKEMAPKMTRSESYRDFRDMQDKLKSSRGVNR